MSESLASRLLGLLAPPPEEDADPQSISPADVESAKMGLPQSVWHLLAAMARGSPVVGYLENLHLADSGTLEMLSFIAR